MGSGFCGANRNVPASVPKVGYNRKNIPFVRLFGDIFAKNAYICKINGKNRPMEIYNMVLWGMAALGAVVFVALYFVDAGYGYLFNPKFGRPVPNRTGWVLMEAPAFVAMVCMMVTAPAFEIVPVLLAVLYLHHYFQRSFIFPLLMRGRSKMPLGIVVMGMVFNTVNAVLIGLWLFWYAPAGYYDLKAPHLWIGIVLFFVGMTINMQADHIVRHLRKPGDTKHYIPRGGMFRYVSSANYFGELVEWTGFAIASWSGAGLLFVWWTFANLVPRSAALYRRYEAEFGDEFRALKRKRIIPFIY